MSEASLSSKVKYLEDSGLNISTKKDVHNTSSRMPPKLRGKHFTNLEYLIDASLIMLTPKDPILSSSYDETSDLSYFEQCFKILSKVGEGSFGSVFKVLSKDNGKFYAVKVSKEPFRNDFDRASKLDEVVQHEKFSYHPNVVTLISAWEEDRHLHIQLELCQSNMLKKESITEKECWNILCDLVLALHEIHKLGIGHFDVKLENILHGYDGLYKLSDFGLMFSLKEDQKKKPNEGDAKYLAPELLSSTDLFSTKADIFSLGISLLELVGNLSLPNNGQVWKALREDTFPYAQTRHISNDLFLIITKMMSSDAQLRPSAAEILEMPSVKAVLFERKGSMMQLARILPSICNRIQPVLSVVASTCAIHYLAQEALQDQAKEIQDSLTHESISSHDEYCLPSGSTLAIDVSPGLCQLESSDDGNSEAQHSFSEKKGMSFITSTPFIHNAQEAMRRIEQMQHNASLLENSGCSPSDNNKPQGGNSARVSSARASTSTNDWIEEQLKCPKQQLPSPARVRTPIGCITDDYSDSIRYPSPSIMRFGLSPLRLSQQLKEAVQSRKSEREEKREKFRKRLFCEHNGAEEDKKNNNKNPSSNEPLNVVPKPKRAKKAQAADSTQGFD